VEEAKIELAYIKNAIEISLLFASVPFVFIRHAALILPVLLFQYIRLKRVTNPFMRGLLS
jgi:hypothetical protein